MNTADRRRCSDHGAGMVASAFEFADVCRKHDYHNFLFSMKASNPLVMASAYRLLAEEQYNRGWDYPLHLGVTGALRSTRRLRVSKAFAKRLSHTSR
jgi:4-hydroxy-3-methylbut-2-en-1-yl diphosphate synthase IspG/GcpE